MGPSELSRLTQRLLEAQSLDDLGLVAAIEWQAEEFQERTGIECEVLVDREDLSVDADLATTLFRIFQEALTNVARHAQAGRVLTRLNRRGDTLELEVRDDGRGITGEQLADPPEQAPAAVVGGTVQQLGDLLFGERRLPGDPVHEPGALRLDLVASQLGAVTSSRYMCIEVLADEPAERDRQRILHSSLAWLRCAAGVRLGLGFGRVIWQDGGQRRPGWCAGDSSRLWRDGLAARCR